MEVIRSWAGERLIAAPEGSACVCVCVFVFKEISELCRKHNEPLEQESEKQETDGMKGSAVYIQTNNPLIIRLTV